MLVSSKDFRRVPTPKDGNCLFHALAGSAHQGGQDAHQKLRKGIVEWTSKNRDNIDSMSLKHWLQVPAMLPPGFNNRSSRNRCSDICEEYVKFMKQDGKWGGTLEIVAVSVVLNQDIHVLKCTDNENQYELRYQSPENKNSTGVIYIFNTGKDHYEEMMLVVS